MKSFFVVLTLIIILGLGGFVYRVTTENKNTATACPADARLCPDGTALGRTGPSCTFPTCPPPNVSLSTIGIEFALPVAYTAGKSPSSDAEIVATYLRPGVASTTESSEISIRRYPLMASSTAIDVIRATAIQDASGMPAPATAFSSITIGSHRFTVVTLGRFEGVVDVAYYLARGNDVLRFDAVDRGVMDWTDPSLVVASLPGSSDLRKMLGTLHGN